MLRVTADIFSGKPNPEWTITDEAEVKAIFREITSSREIIAEAAPPDAGLGFRGVFLESLSDDLTQDLELPASLYIAIGSDKTAARGSQVVERLLSLIPKSERPVPQAPEESATVEALQAFLREQLERFSRTSVSDGAAPVAAEPEAVAPMTLCYYDMTPYNPGFWNNNANVRIHNNCYNYASNKRTNTFAQPGRACGHQYAEVTCPGVTRAALCDGLHRRYDCFPPSQYPRYLVAMAVIPSPNPLERDYHWYRKQKEGFWGHKPGGTAVRNVDNRGVLIADPATCDRGPYTQFCGYFYTCKSQKIN